MDQIKTLDIGINFIFTVLGAFIGIFLQRCFDKKDRKEEQKIKSEEEVVKIQQQDNDDVFLLVNTFNMTAKTLEAYYSGLKEFGFKYFEKETPRIIEILNGNCDMLRQRDTNSLSSQMKTRYFFAKQMIDANIKNLKDDVRLMENPHFEQRIDKEGTIENAISATENQIASFYYAAKHPNEFLDGLADYNKMNK
ncbi:hypothetical protein [Enterococcus hailinensis]|uniref:hypothetical protein n=1 Tax=Enterococcus hailinensis TaxID=3238988 RepID=UPI0038B2BB36